MSSYDDIYGIISFNPSPYDQSINFNDSHEPWGVFDKNQPLSYQSKEQIQAFEPTNAIKRKKNGEISEQSNIISAIGDVEPINNLRLKQQIQYSTLGQQHIQKCRKGQRFQTNNLGKHLKSLTRKILLAFQDAKMLNNQELVSVANFKATNGSKKDFQALFRHKRLRSKLLQYFSTKVFIQDILTSSKLNFKSKLIMIKYLQKLRSVGFDQTISWKD